MDGFRYDYLDSFPTPNLDRIIRSGVRAEAMIPVFPTKTFPNHYSIVTGLYPENHGIIGNRMYDPRTKAHFKIGAGSLATRESIWFEGEPIWITAKKQGLRTATLFWPGSDAAPPQLKPDFHLYYDNRLSYEDRVKQIINWLELPTDSCPHFMTLYFESPDREGHAFGPFAKQTEDACVKVDHHIGMLLDYFEKQDLLSSTNIVVTSDHGMAELGRERMIFIDDYLNENDFSLVETSPKADIIPTIGKTEMIYGKLLGAHPHLKVYRKGEEPERWHHRNHSRITPLFALADPGWSIAKRSVFEANNKSLRGGAHGYDNRAPAMWAIFLATGPAFKSDVSLPAFENIHVYELLCHLLKIKPATNDGLLSTFEDGLSKM
ncbi:UNVERIFIED_CONTAM: hypothetical protein GTU68_065793 [Idotea baltica]|nr:hypothetical protein [Idotea baltica]